MSESLFRAGPTEKIDAKNRLVNGGIFMEDFYTSSQDSSFMQRGGFTLASGKKFITFPRAYLSSTTLQNAPTILVTSQTANHVFVESIAKNSAFGMTTISTICGFTVSGSSSDSGYWLSIGYK